MRANEALIEKQHDEQNGKDISGTFAFCMTGLVTGGFATAYLIALVQACTDDYSIYDGPGAAMLIHAFISAFMGFIAALALREPGKRGELAVSLGLFSWFSVLMVMGISSGSVDFAVTTGFIALIAGAVFCLDQMKHSKSAVTGAPTTSEYSRLNATENSKNQRNERTVPPESNTI